MARRHGGEILELERQKREEVAVTVRIHEAAVSESGAFFNWPLQTSCHYKASFRTPNRFHNFFPNLLGFILNPCVGYMYMYMYDLWYDYTVLEV